MKEKQKNQRKKKFMENKSEAKKVSKTFAKVSIFTKYCILVCQNFQLSKISSYASLMK